MRLSTFTFSPWLEPVERGFDPLELVGINIVVWPGTAKFGAFLNFGPAHLSVGWFELAEDYSTDDEDDSCPVCGSEERGAA